MRLDRGLHTLLSQQLASPHSLSRARLQQLITDGALSNASGQPQTQGARKLQAGEQFYLTLPPLLEATPQAEPIPLNILYEDDALLVLDKPAGLVVHPGAGHPQGTVVNALLHHCGQSLSGIGGVRRPGIVHRLDKDTSGLMVVAKGDNAHHLLAQQFTDRSLSRLYHAICWGVPHPLHGSVTAALGRDPHHRQRMAVLTHGGKTAITHYSCLEVFANGMASLIACHLLTGRTHQIRVHLTTVLGVPLIGDPLYTRSIKTPSAPNLKALWQDVKSFPRQALHATRLSFLHPTLQQPVQFTCDYPADMKSLLDTLRNYPSLPT
jgi:23S rRNA pseudouridine1911/1915/1917 synthase